MTRDEFGESFINVLALGRPAMTRDDPSAAWWCPKCSEAFELGEVAFPWADVNGVFCPNDGCGAELDAA